jgi:hypothetical protein
MSNRIQVGERVTPIRPSRSNVIAYVVAIDGKAAYLGNEGDRQEDCRWIVHVDELKRVTK